MKWYVMWLLEEMVISPPGIRPLEYMEVLFGKFVFFCKCVEVLRGQLVFFWRVLQHVSNGHCGIDALRH